MEKFQGKYRISSARYSYHDYNGGAYYVTICTKSQEHYFGKIRNNEIILSEIGKYANECIETTPEHYLDVEIPVYQIMPNHIHLIVFVNDIDNLSTSDIVIDGDVETEHAPSLQPEKENKITINEQMQIISQRKGRLSSVIGSIKSATIKKANQNNIPFGWQERFNDHIIRNQNEMNRIAEYIKNNPYNWATDEFNNPPS